MEWAEQILRGFSWGHAFIEVNGTLLEKYAKCSSAEEVNNVQEAWLTRLEREWAESRVSKVEQDDWAGGNPNRLVNTAEEEEDENSGGDVNDGEGEEEERDDQSEEDISGQKDGNEHEQGARK